MPNFHNESTGPPRAAWLAAVACAVLSGCGGSDQLPTAPVTGKVLYQGQPLTSGSVLLIPEAGPPARGTIGPDGTFALSTYAEADGAVIGTHQVEIHCMSTPTPKPDEEPLPGKSLIPEKYTRYDTSGLKREVKQGPNSFELTLDDEKPVAVQEN